MRNLFLALVVTVALIGLLNAVGDNRDGGILPANTVSGQANVIILDGNDPFFQGAGVLIVYIGLPLLLLLIFVKGPHKDATVGRSQAVVAAFVLCICLFLLAYLAHSGQTELALVLDAW